VEKKVYPFAFFLSYDRFHKKLAETAAGCSLEKNCLGGDETIVNKKRIFTADGAPLPLCGH
jgi:hypothetical protein